MYWKHCAFSGGYRFTGFANQPEPRFLPWPGESPDPAKRDRVIDEVLEGLDARIRDSREILIYSIESGPFPRPLEVDFPDGGVRIENALNTLKNRYPRHPIRLLLGKRRRRAFSRLFPGGLPREGIDYLSIDDRYPAHLPELFRGVCGLKPEGDLWDGLLSLDELTALCGERDLRWVSIALCGQGFLDNAYVKAPIGASLGSGIAHYLKEGGWRIVAGDPICGEPVTDLSLAVSPGLRCLLALEEGPREESFPWAHPGGERDSWFRLLFSSLRPGKKLMKTNLRGEERACFSCGACIAACPVSLVPKLLYRLALKEGSREELKRFRIDDCISCNLCTYLCPAKIDLASEIAKARGRNLR